MQTSTPQSLLKLKDVVQLTGLSRTTIYNLLNENKFPKRIQITKQRIAFLSTDIDKWISEKVKAGRIN
jgi:prophage regulatory protein